MSKFVPEPDRLRALLAGETGLGCGSLWLITLLKFKDGFRGATAYKAYFDKSLISTLRTFKSKVILRMFERVRTVINGGGLVPEWEACTIIEFPSPAVLGAVLASCPPPSKSLLEMEMHAFDGAWSTATSKFFQAPDSKISIKAARRLANTKLQDPKKMAAINGDMEVFAKYIADPGFESGRIWQLNLLQMEKNPFYGAYAARANSVISRFSGQEGSGGIQFMTGKRGCHTLLGVRYDVVAAMQYPSREAFVSFAMSQGNAGSRDKSIGNCGGDASLAGGAERYVLRTAGLAVQALICLGPDGIPGSIGDTAPSNVRSGRSENPAKL